MDNSPWSNGYEAGRRKGIFYGIWIGAASVMLVSMALRGIAEFSS